jgi:monoamine oxidase
MARTEMFRHLQQLVAVAGEADRRGVDAAEAHGLVTAAASLDAGLTRRDVLKRGAVAAAGATALGSAVLDPRSAWGASKPPSQPRIAIVGAGISGMSAAMTLKDAGFTNVGIYEANSEVGGRTWTNSTFWSPGQWSEWGGELIDTGHKTVFALCQRFGFSLYDMEQNNPSGAADILWFDGGYYPWLEMAQDWQDSGADQAINHMMQTMPAWPFRYDSAWSADAAAIDDMTLAEWIDRTIPGGRGSRLGRFVDVAYNIEFGEETSQQAAANILGLLGFSSGNGPGAFWIYGKSDERYKIQDGNQQIALAQADYVGRTSIRTGYTLTALQRNADGTATLTFALGGGKTALVTADRVILAVPLGVLKKLKATGGLGAAGFDDRKRGLIDALGFGANNKLQLEIADRFWIGTGPWPGVSDGESYADTGYQEAWHVTNGMPGTKGVIVNYTGGDVARILSSTPKPFADTNDASAAVRKFVGGAARTFLSQIEPVFPGMTSRWTGRATLSVWSQSTSAYGAYSYWAPGYLRRYCGYERVQMGPVHFAGEHCSQDYQGYIEGGAVEGIRAATEVVAAYK